MQRASLLLLLPLLLAGVCDAEPRGERASTPANVPTERAPDDRDPRDDPRGEPDDELEQSFAVDESTRFLGEPDAPVRRALATQPVASIEKGRGGRSLAFKITLEDGTVGYYKPEQSFSAAHWYGEVASYYLDRELGLGRVIPTIGRSLPWEPLRAVAAGDQRVAEVTVRDDGTVRGAFIWWVPGGLVPIAPGAGWEGWVRVSGPLGVTPFQRPIGWSENRRSDDSTPANEPDIADRPAELSDMILFDYLTTNVDRWGGSFTNVRTRGRGGPLIYLDNGAGFTAGPTARIPLMDARVHALQRFRQSTVDRIRALDVERLERRMAADPLAPVLTPRHYEQLEERRRHLLEHVAAMEERFGARVFPW
jgi:hypothetical protein